MDQNEIEEKLVELLRQGKTVTITTRRGTPVWLGDVVGRIESVEGSKITIRDRDRTMGVRASTTVSLSSIVAVREARPTDRAGVHNDR